LRLPRRSGHVNENVAREARYRALAHIARSEKCPLLATGHTATDALETHFLNLMRGTSVRGLAGIAPRRPLEEGVSLVRPFWRLARSLPRQLLGQVGWEWREDRSNRDPVFRRNRVRHELLPVLEQISGRTLDEIASAYAAGAQLFRDDLEFLESRASQALLECTLLRQNGLLILDAGSLGALAAALARRVLRQAALQVNPLAAPPGLAAVEEVRGAVHRNGRHQVWQWPGGTDVEWTGVMAGNRVRLRRVRNDTEIERSV
jgi:tRNA(Ile)-lysidine synthase